MNSEKVNQQDRLQRCKLLAAIFKWMGGLTIIALSIMLGAFVFSVASMFDFISDPGNAPWKAGISAESQFEQHIDLGTEPINAEDETPPATAMLSRDRVGGNKFDAFANAWEENGETGEGENENRVEEDTPAEPLTTEEQEIQMLQEALPENSLVPAKRSEQELKRTLESIEEQQYIQTLINNKEATVHDLRRFYDLQAKRFEDEIALIDFCQRIVAEGRSEAGAVHPFCDTVILEGEARRRANQQSLEQLRQDLL